MKASFQVQFPKTPFFFKTGIFFQKQVSSIQDSLFKRLMLLALLVNLAIIILLMLVLPKLPPSVPLFYGRPWGEEQLVPGSLLFFVPAVTILFLILNTTLLALIKEKSLLVIRTLSGFALFSAILGAITLIRILLII